MRKVFLAALVMLAVGLVIAYMPQSAFAEGLGTGIATSGSPHNFIDNLCEGVACTEIGAGGWNAREEICRVCHVPHDHNRNLYTGGLLWNHKLSSQVYTMYSSSTLDGTQSAQPDGIAKLCLGCHDGTVAIDSFDKYAGGAAKFGATEMYPADFLHPGPDQSFSLQGTHPISIVYDSAADSNLKPTTNTMGTSGTIADVLDGTKVQCSSCHDVHDQESVANTHLLRVSQKTPASGLCLTCHIK